MHIAYGYTVCLPACLLVTYVHFLLPFPHTDFFVGQKVVARWRDGKWYAATLCEVSPYKVYLEYYDGKQASVSVQHILPLVRGRIDGLLYFVIQSDLPKGFNIWNKGHWIIY